MLEYNFTDRINTNTSGGSPPPASPVPVQTTSQITHISLFLACKAVTTAIKQEKG